MNKDKSGIWGEVFAARYLRDNGFKILTANYYTRMGEIDLIAREGDCICFIEVKTRKENSFLPAWEAVDEPKIRRLTLTAKSFIAVSKLSLQPRFDVVEVYLNESLKPVSINYIRNAFESEM